MSMAIAPIMIPARDAINKRMNKIQMEEMGCVLLVRQSSYPPKDVECRIIDVDTKEGVLFMVDNDIDYSDIPCVYSVKQHKIIRKVGD